MFKSKSAILFDLDGTIINSQAGIFASVRYAADKLNLPQKSDTQLRAFIGPPLVSSFEKYYNLSDCDAQNAVKIYREFYSSKGVMMFHVYAGLEDTLKALKNAGKRMFVATCKPENFAKIIIENLGFSKYFNGVYGIFSSDMHTTKKQVITRVMQENSLSADECVMVGDTSFDIIGAHECNLSCIAVEYGFADENGLTGAEKIVKSPSDIKSLFI